ncbi:MAG: CoA-binding protein [Burkholderiaceae bacterium]
MPSYTTVTPAVADLLKTPCTIAVVGLSPKPQRPSHGVAAYMQANGFRIVPVNPGHANSRILGESCHATLKDAAAAIEAEGGRIDIVDCFRQSDAIPPIADDAVAIGATCLWMQIGVVNLSAADKAAAAGLAVVMDRCIKIDHAMLRR